MCWTAPAGWEAAVRGCKPGAERGAEQAGAGRAVSCGLQAQLLTHCCGHVAFSNWNSLGLLFSI